MTVNLGLLHGEPQLLEVRDGIAYINGQPEPIKYLTEEEVETFARALDAIGEDPALEAMRNAKRVEFIVKLLDRTVGDETMEYLEELMSYLHFQILCFLGEAEVDGQTLAEEDEVHKLGHFHHHYRDEEESGHHHHHDGCCDHEHHVHEHAHEHGKCSCGHHGE